MKVKLGKDVYSACAAAVIIIFAVFTARLINWQLLSGSEYQKLAYGDAAEEQKSSAVRGEILDKNGEGLIVNQTKYKVVVDKSEVDNPETEKTINSLAGILKNQTESPDNGEVEYTINSKSAPAVAERLQDTGGVKVVPYLERSAADPTLAPHILGALGSISQEEYEELKGKDGGYDINDKIGKFGIEAAYEDCLRGEAGEKLVFLGANGTVESEEIKTAARRGDSVWLTIDKKLQKTAVKSLEQNVRDARAEGESESRQNGGSGYGEDCESGAVVMLSVRDFSVLAAASCPTFDLNKYSLYGDYYTALAQNESAPMFDRAFSGTFACGSVFKPCVALAALESGTITRSTEFCCTKYYDYYPSNVVECMHTHGYENVTSATAHSCNWFFAETGRRLGIKSIDSCAEKLGLGVPTGLETGEANGILAGRDSADWQAGNTVQAAIGQSDNAFTPLQLATYTATLANSGTRLKTHIVSKITSYDKTEVKEDFTAPQTVCKADFSKKNMSIVQNAMREVAQNPEGTAYSVFGGYEIEIAAKTGTAENAGSDHAVFICYAPFENPEVAIAVVIEHGVKGKYAMQVAKDLLDEYYIT